MHTKENRQVKLAIGNVKYKATDPTPNDYLVIFSILALFALGVMAVIHAPQILLPFLPVLKKIGL